MPNDPKRPREHTPEQEEYRRRQQAKAKRRRQQQMHRVILLGSCVVGVALLVTVFVMIIRSITNPKEKALVSSSDTAVISEPADAGAVANLPKAADPSVWNLVLINNQNKMPDGFSPETVSIDNIGHQVDARMADALTQMMDACNAVAGNNLAVISAQRGPQTQNGNYQNLVDIFKGQGMSAEQADEAARRVDPPYGYSDHQTALAVDFIGATVTEAAQAFAETPESAWLREHAVEYGFVLRFPENKGAITGIDYQPYHYRYVGVEDAQAMASAAICLEEYVAATPAASPASDGASGETGEAGGSSAPAI